MSVMFVSKNNTGINSNSPFSFLYNLKQGRSLWQFFKNFAGKLPDEIINEIGLKFFYLSLIVKQVHATLFIY
jgi:hypothetical protein